MGSERDEDLAELSAAMLASAESLRKMARESYTLDLAFDAQAVQWLEGYIQAFYERADEATKVQVIQVAGAFLGECLVRCFGGGWWRFEKSACIVFDGEIALFPLSKVQKQLEQGAQAEGVARFFNAFASMHAQKQPPTPALVEDHFVPTQAPLPMLGYLIEQLRRVFSAQTKAHTAQDFDVLQAHAPSWMEDGEALLENVRQQKLLLTEGNIVWAGLVQANSTLFEAGEVDCPALLVYSSEKYFDARPHELRAIAHKIFDIKNSSPSNAELKKVADIVTSELDRPKCHKLPSVLTAREVSMSAFMVFRKHLPDGFLRGGIFPILIHPATQAVMIVPVDYWPQNLLRKWEQRFEEPSA